MKNYQKNPKNLFTAFSCMFAQLKATVYEKFELMAFEMPYVEFEFESSVQTNSI